MSRSPRACGGTLIRSPLARRRRRVAATAPALAARGLPPPRMSPPRATARASARRSPSLATLATAPLLAYGACASAGDRADRLLAPRAGSRTHSHRFAVARCAPAIAYCARSRVRSARHGSARSCTALGVFRNPLPAHCTTTARYLPLVARARLRRCTSPVMHPGSDRRAVGARSSLHRSGIRHLPGFQHLAGARAPLATAPPERRFAPHRLRAARPALGCRRVVGSFPREKRE